MRCSERAECDRVPSLCVCLLCATACSIQTNPAAELQLDKMKAVLLIKIWSLIVINIFCLWLLWKYTSLFFPPTGCLPAWPTGCKTQRSQGGLKADRLIIRRSSTAQRNHPLNRSWWSHSLLFFSKKNLLPSFQLNVQLFFRCCFFNPIEKFVKVCCFQYDYALQILVSEKWHPPQRWLHCPVWSGSRYRRLSVERFGSLSLHI